MAYTYTQGTVGHNDWTYHSSSHFGEDVVYIRVWTSPLESVLTPFPSYVFFDIDPRTAHFGDEAYLEEHYASIISNQIDITTYKTAIFVAPDNAITVLQKRETGDPQPCWLKSLAKYNATGGLGRDSYHSRSFNGVNEVWTYESSTSFVSPDIPIFYDYNNCIAYLNNTDLTNDDPTNFGGVYENDTPTDTDDTSDDVGDSTDFIGLGGAGGLKLIKICKMDGVNINLISDLLSNGWLSGNAGRCLISLKKMLVPQTPSIFSANATVIDASGAFSIDVKGDILAKQIEKIELGSYNFTRYYGDFRDFKPYTSIQLYLPFCGVVDVDPNDVVGGKLSLSCNIDYLTGNVVYYGKVNNDGVNKTIYTWNGNCSMDLPITAEDMSRRLTGALAGLGVMGKSIGNINPGSLGKHTSYDSYLDLGAGNPLIYMGTKYANPGLTSASGAGGVLGGMAGGAIMATVGSAIVNPFTMQGQIGQNNGFGGILEPFIIFRRCKSKNIKASVCGKPVNASKTLNDCHGYTRVGQIHLNIPGATKYELEYINNILKTGVILP